MSEGREELEAAKTEDDPELKKLLEESGAPGLEAGQRMLDWCEKKNRNSLDLLSIHQYRLKSKTPDEAAGRSWCGPETK